jgi:hypothetical protein
VERAPRLAPGPGGVGRRGPLAGALGVERHHRVDRAVEAVDAVEEVVEQLDARHLALAQQAHQLGGRQVVQVIQRRQVGRGHQRSSRRSSLPASPFGNSSTKTTVDGHL